MRESTQRNAMVISRLSNGFTRREVSAEFGISRTRVDQIWRRWVWEQKSKTKRVGLNAEVRLYAALLNLRRITTKLHLMLEP